MVPSSWPAIIENSPGSFDEIKTERQVPANPQIKPTALGREFADRLLPSPCTVAIYYYSAHALMLVEGIEG